MKKSTRTLASTAGALAILAVTATQAFACDQTTVSGDQSVGCAVKWNVESVYTSDASLYPAGLLTGQDGQPVNGGALGGNGGYISEVTPATGDHGIFEINRFLTGSGDSLTLHVRIPIATEVAIENGSFQLSLPDTGSAWNVMADSPAQAKIATWGTPYSNYSWTLGAASNVTVNGTTATATYASLAAHTGSVIEFTSLIPSTFLDSLSDYRASFKATDVDKSGCTLPLPTVTQTQVNGNNNDAVTPPANMTSTTGWKDNTQTFTSTAPEGYYYNDNGTYTTSINTTVKDNGTWPTKTVTTPVYGQVKILGPAYTFSQVCTDPVVGTFQVDSYRPTTAAMVATVKANSLRNTLPYRFDGPNAPQLAKAYHAGSYASLWGHSTSEFVTIKLSDVTKAGSLRAAIDAKSVKAPNLGGTIAVGKTYTTAWKLATGATTANPWTARPDTSAAKAQTEFDKVVLPKASCTMKATPIKQTVTVKTVQTGTKTTTVTLPPAAVVAPTWSIPA